MTALNIETAEGEKSTGGPEFRSAKSHGPHASREACEAGSGSPELTEIRLPVEWVQLQVYVPLVAELGEGPAIVLHQLIYLTRGEKARLIDGRRWIFYSFRHLAEKFFPWWSHTQVRNHVQTLRERKLLLTRDDLNREPYDRTQWYAINWDEVKRLDAYTVKLSPGALEPTPAQFRAADTENAGRYRYIHAGLAVQLGLGPSLLLRHLMFMLGQFGCYIERDGARWIHMSARRLLYAYFPWWSESTIRRHFGALRREGLIAYGEYSPEEDAEPPRDFGVPWIRLDRAGLAQLDVSVPPSWCGQEGEPEPAAHGSLTDGLQPPVKTLQPPVKIEQGEGGAQSKLNRGVVKTLQGGSQNATTIQKIPLDSETDSDKEPDAGDSQERESPEKPVNPLSLQGPDSGEEFPWEGDGATPRSPSDLGDPDAYVHPAVLQLRISGGSSGQLLDLPLAAAQEIAAAIPASGPGLEAWLETIRAALAAGVSPTNVACFLDWWRDPKRRYSRRTVGRQAKKQDDRKGPDYWQQVNEEMEQRRAAVQAAKNKE